MKVYLGNTKASSSVGGMFRVFETLHKYLPEQGITIVNNPQKADVLNPHIALFEELPQNKPLVVSSHGLLWGDNAWNTKHAWGINSLCLDSYLQADIVTAPSRFVADTIARQTSIPVKVVHHGIDVETWQGSSPDPTYVLWNKARIDPANEIEDVLKLAAQVPDIPFKLSVGQSALPNVEIIGKVDPSEVKPLVQNALVYLDTPRESGGPCFGVLEAMALGVPVLSWNYGGTAEVIRHTETGYLAEPGNLSDLLRGLLYCIKYREQIGKAARDEVEKRYTVQHSVQEYLKVYQQALDEFHTPVKISVITPCYNLGNYLPLAVDSVLAQTTDDWELILVDDASTDNSKEIVAQQAERDPRIRAIYNPTNLHVADTRNRAIWEARGKYILPLDADDRITADTLELLSKELDKDRSIAACTGKLKLHSEDDLTQGRIGPWPDNTDSKLQIQGENRLPYCSMYRKRIWEQVGGYRRRIRSGVEDADFWTRALSYGHKAKLINHVTLLYTIRSKALHTLNDKGNLAWMPWYPWWNNPDKAPAGLTMLGPRPIYSVDSPVVSIIIPVGPGHEPYIQACLDSLVAQSHPYWEAIFVNDTGQQWFKEDRPVSYFLLGTSIATLLDGNKNHGVAHARNRGIQQAKASHIIFLDVDDVAQPDMIARLISTQGKVGGWVYGDWLAASQGQTKLVPSTDWNAETILNRSLGPITGIYLKEHILQIGGFNEQLRGWEDWDFHLRLVERGICGTRLAYPLIAYNMDLGQRREDNFKQRDNLLQYISKRYAKLRETFTKDLTMACKTCGGKPTVKVTSHSSKSSVIPDPEVVELMYIGSITQIRTYRSKTHPGAIYRVNPKRSFLVYREDVGDFLKFTDFKRVERGPIVTEVTTFEHNLTVDNNTRNNPSVETVLANLKPEVVNRITAQFATLNDLRAASDSDLLSIKGIGASRLEDIRREMAQWS